MPNNAQLINQTSGGVEYYTPPKIVEAARGVMGDIDLDPASSYHANLTVKARVYFDNEGLTQDWFGRVWMNHPFGRETNAAWINKLETEFTGGLVIEACCITFACTSEKWFQPLLKRPQCFLSPRTNYFSPSGELKRGVTKGSVVTYYGTNFARFDACFRHLGITKLPLL